MFKWKEGRQKTGYRIMKLFAIKWPIAVDSYLIHYPMGSYINEHSDDVDGYNHYRCNITLKRAKKGGGFGCLGSIFKSKYLNIFRSDLSHKVYEITEGSRWVLSFGYCKKLK